MGRPLNPMPNFTPPPGFPSDEYFAGFFDGEGHVSLLVWKNPRYPHHSYSLKLAAGVSNKNEKVLTLFRERWGSGIVKAKKRRRSGVDASVFLWTANAHNAARFLREIRPYMHVKGPEADIALEFFDFQQTNKVKHHGTLADSDHPSIVKAREFQKRLRAARLERDGGIGRWQQ